MKRVFRFRPLDTLFPLPLTSTSVAAARAFVLYQDLRIEVACIWTSKLETAPPTITPDEIGVMYRRAYFLRRALATLEEFRQVAKTLGRQRVFVEAVHEHPLALQKWLLADAFFEENCQKIKDLRNSLGGHMTHDVVKGALQVRDDSDIATFQAVFAGEGKAMAIFTFARNIMGRVFFVARPAEVPHDEYFASVLGVTTDGIAAAANCVDALFAVQILPKIR